MSHLALLRYGRMMGFRAAVLLLASQYGINENFQVLMFLGAVYVDVL